MKKKITNVMLAVCIVMLTASLILAPITMATENKEVEIVLGNIMIYGMLGVLFLGMIMLFINIDNL